jgi:hypothetical protein
MCSLLWLWQWLFRHINMSKLSKLCTLTMSSLLYVSYTWIQLFNKYTYTYCSGLNASDFLQNLHVEILTPKVIVLGGGAFRRWLGHKDGTFVNRISACYSLDLECPPKAHVSLACWHHWEMVETLRGEALWKIFRSFSLSLCLSLSLTHTHFLPMR